MEAYYLPLVALCIAAFVTVSFTILDIQPEEVKNQLGLNEHAKQLSNESLAQNIIPAMQEDYIVTCSLIDVGGKGLNMSVSYGYEAVKYGIIVENVGNKSLTGVTLYDSWDSITGPVESLDKDGVLQQNERWVYTGRYVAPREDLITYDSQECGFLVDSVRVVADNAESKRAELKVPILYDKYEFAFPGNGSYVNVGADGHTITLKNNLSAQDVTYSQVIYFIYVDDTDKRAYDDATCVCADYTETVHNAAEAAGIKCGWVEINFVDGSADHACNAFKTTDRGVIYVDCTEEDKIVNLQVGQPYVPESLFDTTEYYSMPVVSDFKVFW